MLRIFQNTPNFTQYIIIEKPLSYNSGARFIYSINFGIAVQVCKIGRYWNFLKHVIKSKLFKKKQAAYGI
jgi:hypothetical protein